MARPELRLRTTKCSPDGVSSPIRIVDISFRPGARVAFETGSRERVVHQQLWVLEGSIELALGSDRHLLEAGDCLAMTLDRPTMFHNPTDKTARYAVVDRASRVVGPR